MAIKYGKESRANIAELHPDLQRLLDRYSDVAPAELDLKVIDAFRGEAEQNKAHAEGNSTKPWPESAHNKKPARAFDFTPFPFTTWDDLDQFLVRQGALRLVAAQHGIRLKPLISWNDPKRVTWDAGHVELADA